LNRRSTRNRNYMLYIASDKEDKLMNNGIYVDKSVSFQSKMTANVRSDVNRLGKQRKHLH